ncbi:MAG: SAM-dependent methyltransferase [Chromatiales bacterium]|nr:SAM-dependent methyltransferase [Chromatiales bacterium]
MSLPDPDPNAAAQSRRLCARIADEIRLAGGWIPFARYMELVLYAPSLGYYSGGAAKFGGAGDFVTAPELSPLFADTLAAQVAQIMATSAGQIIEAGPGTGALAAEMLLELERRGALPERYMLLELSAELRSRQRATIEQRAPKLATRVSWLDRLPQHFSGAVIANEVLDAMPTHLVAWGEDGIFERGLTTERQDRFRWEDRPATGALLEAARTTPVTPPYLSEIGLAARAWVGSWGEILDQGILLLVDYGFPARELYHPQRSGGTLMCHYRHHAHDDPLYLPGLNDITAHVDFTAVAEAGADRTLDLYGYTSQAQFLLNCGITEVLARICPEDSDGLPAASVRRPQAPQPVRDGRTVQGHGIGQGHRGAPDRF